MFSYAPAGNERGLSPPPSRTHGGRRDQNVTRALRIVVTTLGREAQHPPLGPRGTGSDGGHAATSRVSQRPGGRRVRGASRVRAPTCGARLAQPAAAPAARADPRTPWRRTGALGSALAAGAPGGPRSAAPPPGRPRSILPPPCLPAQDKPSCAVALSHADSSCDVVSPAHGTRCGFAHAVSAERQSADCTGAG